MLIYVHGANDPESRLPAGLLDIGVSKRQIAVISKTDMPDADVAATRKLLLETGFEEPIFELNSHDPQSVQQLVDYLASLTKHCLLIRSPDQETSSPGNPQPYPEV